jgi:hypothetical protein
VNPFKNLWTAVGQLAAALANLAETVNGIDGQLRQRAGLDETPPWVEANGQAEPVALAAGRKKKTTIQPPTE